MTISLFACPFAVARFRLRALRYVGQVASCGATTHACGSGTKKLPFAGYSAVCGALCFCAPSTADPPSFDKLPEPWRRRVSWQALYKIVWDDLRSSRADIWRAASEGPQATKIPPLRRIKFPGGHRRGVTPVPIPNTEVKPSTADGTAWETAWESRSLPGLFSRPPSKEGGLFLRTREPSS